MRDDSILHVIAAAGRPAGGLGPVAINLAYSQSALGAQTAIWSLDTPTEVDNIIEDYGPPLARFQTFQAVGPARLAYSPEMLAAARGAAGRQFSLLHLHSLWTATSLVALRWGQTHHRPVVITPHGTLDAWALAKSRGRKQLALWAYEYKNLHRAACIHALSGSEQRACREFGLQNPIAIIPNGVTDDWLESTGDRARFLTTFGLPADAQKLLFVSRVTPKKGLPLLLTAMAEIKPQLHDWLLLIVGPDEFGHTAELTALVEKHDLGRYVRFLGPLYGQAKRDAFAAADIFVLPSHSEGAPIAVLEALAAGLPVLTTTATPLEELTTSNCGWRVPPEVAPLREALQHAVTCTPTQRAAIGRHGRELIVASYSWRTIAQQMLEVYQWVLTQGPPPACVEQC